MIYLHGHGLVHREIRPRNILVAHSNLRILLLDPGIVREANPEVRNFTATRGMTKDLLYASPEQLHLEKVTVKSDIWATAAILYDLLLPGTRRMDADFDTWTPAEQHLQRIPSQLAACLAKALAKAPTDRYASAEDFRRDLLDVHADGHKAVALHGIRTHAAWQRAFSEVAHEAGIDVRMDKWNFGYFSVFRFLSPWSRQARVSWFREAYEAEFGVNEGSVLAPSIVAHSFGTYILGNAMLRYPYLRFERVLLCGSILPVDFPWDEIIARGQVRHVRNEYGSHDLATRIVGWFIPGTGPSGIDGFTAQGPAVSQERFSFSHSEYFSRAHMTGRWLPFLGVARTHMNPPSAVDISYSARSVPWGLVCLYSTSVGVIVALTFALMIG
jgi:serine/threonine-protein kinase